MKTIKKVACIALAALMVLSVSGCSKKAATQKAFIDLELGATKDSIETELGTDYESLGSEVIRMNYTGLKMFDFLAEGENTKLVVFLNTENKAYAYAFYMYDAVDGNYSKVKEYFEKLYGSATEGENESEQWYDGETTYSLNNQGTYVAIGKF